MRATDLTQGLDERLQEIEAYLALLGAVQEEARNGAPRVGANGPVITTDQQKILHSGVYLQLYNLVEATITRCVNAVADAAAEGGRWRPHDLTLELRREWVRHSMRTHIDLSYDNRLKSALEACDRLIEVLPVVEDFKIEKGGGGNWDDTEIEGLAERLGVDLRISPATRRLVKERKWKDDRGALKLVRDLRNDLAHGSLSFAECGTNVTVDELREVKEGVALYLREVVGHFAKFIAGYEFLLPKVRPQLEPV